MTFDQQEPSANSPWTKTTFLVFGDVWALATRSSRGRAALAAAAAINIRRFIIVLLRGSPAGKIGTRGGVTIKLAVRIARLIV